MKHSIFELLDVQGQNWGWGGGVGWGGGGGLSLIRRKVSPTTNTNTPHRVNGGGSNIFHACVCVCCQGTLCTLIIDGGSSSNTAL